MKRGIPASKGYAIGEVVLQIHNEVSVSTELISNVEAEKENFVSAVKKSKEQLEKIKEHTEQSIGAQEAAIFDAHIMLLEDPELITSIVREIEENHNNAIRATSLVTDKFIAIFDAMEDEYLRERAADLKDVAGRLITNLTGNHNDIQINLENTIVVAHDLTPSDTAQLDRSKVVAFLTDVGGKTSHSAIMARIMGIPAIVGMGDITSVVKNGDQVIVDGVTGTVIINPSTSVLAEYQAKIKNYAEEQDSLKKLVSAEAFTQSGKRIYVAGNIGKPEDLEQVNDNGGDGVGLFRTEFLYMDRTQAPSEQEQYESYRTVLEQSKGKVVIRTLDIGGDKQLPYLKLPAEMNPFLGYRAIRFCLDQKDIFKTQLRALLRAAAHGELSVMFPMISGLNEFLSAKEVVRECELELEAEGISYSKQIEWGIMVEIPSAAICAELLAPHVDFFSIGTNDLVQYTLAVDRMSEKVSYLYDPMHPAVLHLIKMTIDAAHKYGKWVGMCGEMAGDELAIPLLVEYGLDEFSMSASSILQAKKLIMNCK
ncbi:MAG: ptsP [Herbinix sp.]|jgi:phosphotransferase system enzyme I (PtsI)|nr:ptsP [Herbinix sp.]